LRHAVAGVCDDYFCEAQLKFVVFILVTVVIVVCTACATPSIVAPTTKGCRNNEQTCSDHACCPESNFVCGGDVVGCFANYCCPVGGPLGPDMLKAPAVLKRRP
jgi:hypothetical protein